MVYRVVFSENVLMVYDDTDRKILDQPFNPYTLEPWASESDALSWWGIVNPAYEQATPNPDEPQQQTPTE